MKKLAFLFTLVAAMLFVFTACGSNDVVEIESTVLLTNPPVSEQPMAEETDDIFHEVSDLGFSFMLPSSWEGKYSINEDSFENDFGIVRSIRVSHITTQDELGLDFAGTLFWIHRFPGYYGMENDPGVGLILAQAGGYTYAISYPQDSAHAHDSVSQAAIQFNNMMSYLEPFDNNFVTNSFRHIATEESGGILHQFDTLGFSVAFPAFWEGKYGFDEFYVELDFGIRHFVTVYHLATREELGHSGTLFTLGVSPRDHYTYDGERPIMAGGMIFLAQAGGNTYFASFPSGVEHNEEPGSETAAEYLEMVGCWESSHWDFLVNSFRLIDSTMQAMHRENDGISYRFDNLGFSFVFPASWADKYGMTEHDGTEPIAPRPGVQIHHLATQEEMGSEFAGFLFSFIKTPVAFEDEIPLVGDVLPPWMIVLAVSETYVYLLQIPTDSDWTFEELQESANALEFSKMRGQIDFIVDNFRLIEH